MIDLKLLAEMAINEGLLDDIDDQLEFGDKYMDNERAMKWAAKSKKKPYIAVQKKGILMCGDIKIDDIDERQYTGKPIKKVAGNLSICNCEIESLEGLFLPDCEVTGTLTIEDCPNFTSLAGAPVKVGTLVISGCKSFKTIDKTPIVGYNMYLYKNGKKFKEEELRKNDNVCVLRKIFCSEIDDANLINEEAVNEAFKAPQLSVLADAIKKVSTKDREYKPVLTSLLNAVPLDKISASDISEYDTDDPEAGKMLKLYISGKRRGFYYFMNMDGTIRMLGKGKELLSISGRYEAINNHTYFHDARSTDILHQMSYSDFLVIVDTENYEDIWKTRKARRDAREGALVYQKGKERTNKQGNYSWDTSDLITPKQVRYYQEIADANRKRYQAMLTEIKAKKATMTGNFTKIKERLDKAFARYTALLAKIHANPKNFCEWDVDWLNDKFFSSSHGKYSTSDYGLFKAIEVYFSYVISASQGSVRYLGGNTIEGKLADLEHSISNWLTEVERKLSELEAKAK